MSSKNRDESRLELNSNDTDLREKMIDRYKTIRKFSEELTQPLYHEDMVIQSMPDVSPTKWHLAHTSWFFETFILREVSDEYKLLNPLYPYLFNSYYVQAGERWARPQRGLLSRPTVSEVLIYRKYIDDNMLKFLSEASIEILKEYRIRINIGLHHEQQHQELMLTDIKHVLSLNPLHPVYNNRRDDFVLVVPEMKFDKFGEGVYEIGFEGEGFFYDNEKPRHKVYLNAFEIADRLVTNGEYLEFIDDGGYKNPLLWLSDGWMEVEKEGWKAPLYWEENEGEWSSYRLNGYKAIIPSEPVAHISFYEADAFARWKGMRLPTEGEWEIAVQNIEVQGNFAEDNNFHPLALNKERAKSKQFFGDLWEWSASPYVSYPGYKAPEGALGEYNGKFMANQYVLRGGSCATSVTHIRRSYRNFFYPNSRWQFMGLRLAKDL